MPNREVKPISADGTTVMWESMSPPLSYKKPFLLRVFLYPLFKFPIYLSDIWILKLQLHLF